MKRMMKRVFAMSMALLVLGACSKEITNDKAVQKDKKEELVAIINSEGITKTEYEAQLESAQQQGLSFEGMDKKMQDKMRMSILNQMVNAELLLQSAEKEGVELDQKDLDAEMEKIKSGFENKKEYKEALKKNLLTEDELKSQVKKQMLVTKYIDSKVGKISVDETEIKKMYEEYKKETEGLDQAPKKYKEVKPQLQQQMIAKKKDEKATKLIEVLRKENEKNIEIRL
ncbi:SurA N-terminal domain-containing protein [Bacillus sp. REN3]|uniref:SurA N-terminal domain-containing protein n=1 Tax=Bacillus sp. REN3 TaxID=2802440 RepID=UPI001AEEA1E6|nr:SurA N-terminal domain-containing protein [Bacillus sp. REN3]